MVKCLFWTFILFVLFCLMQISFGMYCDYIVFGIWSLTSSIFIFVALLLALVVMTMHCIDELKSKIEKIAKKIKAWIDGLPPFIKKLLGIK